MENQNEQKKSPEAPQMKEAPADMKKLWGVLGYIISVLFFVPLVMDELKANAYSKFHANQQLILLISWLVVNIVGGVIPVLGWFIIMPIGNIILLVLMIVGVINAANDKMKPLPLIGGFKLIK